MNEVNVKVKNGIRIVVSECDQFISDNDMKMDARAREAVKTAVSKAKFCQKPVAGYDVQSKRAYVEYANGERKYVN